MLHILTFFRESAESVFPGSGRLNSFLSGEQHGSREVKSLHNHGAGNCCFLPSVKEKANFHLHPAWVIFLKLVKLLFVTARVILTLSDPIDFQVSTFCCNIKYIIAVQIVLSKALFSG